MGNGYTGFTDMAKRKERQEFLFIDIVALKVIQEVLDQTGTPVSRAELYTDPDTSLVNKWLEDHKVTIPLYTTKLTGNRVIQESITLLRRLGFITEKKNSPYEITQKGKDFLKQEGEDWRRWIVEAELTGNEIDESTINRAPF